MAKKNLSNCNSEDVLIYNEAINGWIQPSISESNIPFSNETIIHGIYAASQEEKIKIIESSDPWFWTQGWQKLEEEADEDIAEGRFTSHKNMNDFIADLND